MSRGLYERFRRELRGTNEQVGFFLAHFDPQERAFVVRDWRAIPVGGFEDRGPYHITLADEAKVEVIRWAWNSGLCLVEAHSHGELTPAKFSPSDLLGLREWVPHLFWRLRHRPYAALVVAGEGFDGLAWVDRTDDREPIEAIQLDDGGILEATGLTTNDPTQRHGREQGMASDE